MQALQDEPLTIGGIPQTLGPLAAWNLRKGGHRSPYLGRGLIVLVNLETGYGNLIGTSGRPPGTVGGRVSVQPSASGSRRRTLTSACCTG